MKKSLEELKEIRNIKPPKKFSTKLKALRKEYNRNNPLSLELSYQKIYRDINIHFNTLSDLENKEELKRIDVAILRKIVTYFDVSYDYLLNDECTNKLKTDININRELGLNDEAIRTIKKLNVKERETFNKFLSGINLKKFLNNLKTLMETKERLKKENELLQICNLKPLLEYYSQNNMKKEITEIFNCFRGLIKDEYKNAFNLNYANYLDVIELKYLKKDIPSKYSSFDYYTLDDLSIELYLEERIGYSSYIITNDLNQYLSSIEGFNDLYDLVEIKPNEKIKEYMKIQNKLIKEGENNEHKRKSKK